MELNQADRSISLHPTTQFYSELLDRYSLEDAKGGETPTIELDQKASRWQMTILDAKRSKLYKQSVGTLVWLSLLRPDKAFAAHSLCRSLSKPTENDEEQLRSLLKYTIKNTQTYTVSLKTPRKWKRAKNLELLAFSTAWGETSRQATCVSLFFLGVHLATSIQQQATTRAAADLLSVRLATNLACHTKSLLQNMRLEKPLSRRVLTRGPVAQKLGLSKQTRHIELSRSQLGQFQLSKVQPKQNLAEQLANNHTACSLHKLLPKLQMQARPAGKLALPTVRCKGRAFSSSSLGNFYIGILCRASAMEKPGSEQLSGKESEKHLDLPELQSALSNESLQSDELAAAYSKGSLQDQSLQPDELEAAYVSSSFQDQSLQQRELSAAYAPEELDSTAVTFSSLQQKELGRLETFQPDSSTRASDAKPEASTSSTRASTSQLVASTSSPRASRKQLRDREFRIFPSLVRFIVNLMVHGLILHSLSLLSSSSSLTCISLSFPSSFPIGWAHYLQQDELQPIFGNHELENKAKINRTCKEEENEKQEELQIRLWEQELEKHLVDKSFWIDQLQQNLLETDEQQELDNPELEEKIFHKSFQKMSFLKKLDALLLEWHFAKAASHQLCGIKAWEKHREASKEISSDKKKGDKELPQQLRRQELDCKDLRSASFRALCPTSFEENSFTEETFSNTSLGEETFKESSLPTSSFTRSSLTESSLTRSSLTESSLTGSSLTKNSLTTSSFPESSLTENSFFETSFSANTFLENSFLENTFLRNSFSENSLDQSSLEAKTFSTAMAQTAASTERPSDRQLRTQQLGGTELPPSSVELSSLNEGTFSDSSLEESSFQTSSFEKSSLDRSSLHKRSLAKHSFTACAFNKSSLEESSFDTSSFPKQSFSKSSLDQSSLQPNSFEDSLDDRSLQKASLARESLERTTLTPELAQLPRRLSSTELAKLAQRPLHTKLAELDSTSFR